MAGAWEAALPPGLRWSSAQTLSRGLRQPGAVAPATAQRRGPPELSDPEGARAERPLAVSTLGACAPGLAQVRGVCPSPCGPHGDRREDRRGAGRGMLRSGWGTSQRRPGGGAASEAALVTRSHAPLSLQQGSEGGGGGSPRLDANLGRAGADVSPIGRAD